LVKLPPLRALTGGRSDILVALVDGPVATDVAAFAGARLRPLGREGSCTRSGSAACGHGTFVAGLLAGICGGCTLLIRPIFAEEGGELPQATPEELADAVRECVAAGARVINLSVALRDAGRAARVLEAALDEAAAAGVLVVAATGNQSQVGSSVLTRHPAVLPVAACGADGQPTGDTNLSRSLGERGLLAPGAGVDGIGGDGQPVTMGGTSVAAPFVSGTAALLWSLFPDARAADVRRALIGQSRPRRLVPPLLDAWGAYQSLSKTGATSMSEPETRSETPPPTPAVKPVARPAAAGAVHAAGCGCTDCQATEDVSYSMVYALGRIETRFPTLGIEKEYAQLVARGDGKGKTDQHTFADTVGDREHRYLARQLCWVFSVEGLPTYILKPRDPADLDLLVSALRPAPRPTDVDVVIGVRGPMAPPEMCNGLVLPIVIFDQLYSFDVDALLKSIPRPEKVSATDFGPAAEELFFRIQQMADNAGAVDEHRALNYLAVRYPSIYARAAEAFAQNASLTSVEARPSRLTGTRRVHDVIFTFTNRATDVAEKHFVRVDVTEQFPFLVSKLSPYYDR
jgi:hypothetical protein